MPRVLANETSEAVVALKLLDDGFLRRRGLHDLVVLAEGFVVAPLP